MLRRNNLIDELLVQALRKSIDDFAAGPPGQQFECWLVARLPDGELGIVYSEYGHADKWDLVWIADRWFGFDYCWFSRLEDAMINGGWNCELPKGYVVD